MDRQDTPADIMTRALIAEGISLLGVMLLLAAIGPGRFYARAALNWAQSRARARGDRIDAQVRQFAADISRWDHEQAAQPHRLPGREQPGGAAG